MERLAQAREPPATDAVLVTVIVPGPGFESCGTVRKTGPTLTLLLVEGGDVPSDESLLWEKTTLFDVSAMP